MAHEPTGLELFLTEIKVSDWASTVRWYVETLGMRLLLEDPDHQYALLGAGRGRLALKGGSPEGLDRDLVRLIIRVERPGSRAGEAHRPGSGPRPARRPPDEGYREVRLHDPEGTPIRLFSWITLETTPEAAARPAPLDPWRP